MNDALARTSAPAEGESPADTGLTSAHRLRQALTRGRSERGRTLLRPRPIATAIGIASAIVTWIVLTQMRGSPVDAWDYFVDPSAPYSTGTVHHYLYTPAFAQIVAPILGLGFDAFAAFLRALELAAAVFLAGPVLLPALLLSPVASEINAANINLVLMAAVVLGFRWPGLWSIVLLTKPTLGIGLLWFVVRREWRPLAIALGTTAVIAAISFAINPRAWFDYASLMLTVDKTPGWPFPWPIWVRIPIALPIVVWGSLTGRRWAIGLGAIVAMPRLYFTSISMLLGLLPLISRPRDVPVRVDSGWRSLGLDRLPGFERARRSWLARKA